MDNIGKRFRVCAECGEQIDVRKKNHVWVQGVAAGSRHGTSFHEFYFHNNCFLSARADWDEPNAGD